MLADRVMCAVPNPGPVDVGSTITLGAAPTGYRSYLVAFGGAKPAYFVLSDGAGRTLTGIWTVNATVPETATITEILGNDRTGTLAGETFAGDCVAWNAQPASVLGVYQRWRTIGRTTAAGASAVIFSWPADARLVRLRWAGVSISAAAELILRCRVGTTSEFGASDYIYAGWSLLGSATPAPSYYRNDGANAVLLSGTLAAARPEVRGEALIYPGSVSAPWSVDLRSAGRSTGLTYDTSWIAGLRTSNGRKDGIDIRPNTGTVSGEFICEVAG